ncbi:extracellular solute-binding protein [Paenibacillus eucommiae]|uniref:ABC-type glycerol-3-phosphate transport system substrate-binding protein n=1 Tax=Paenibacillus eucommiae TaxID=1355755 RepID=A0ABS4IU56_9BACL|nr:extracellular solute-binding protein [Paenibacillus eucommiae]MBP1990104.1 ABC-type glycerol-3-phosphate transport system substrate-binding protein [Paenibacillus eucommiae]
MLSIFSKKMFKSSIKNVMLISLSVLMVAALAACSSTGTSGKPETTDAKDGSGTTKPGEAEKVYVYANSGNLNHASTLSKQEDYEAVRQEIIRQSGFEIVPIIPPKSQEGEKLNLLLASNEKLDIFMGDYKAFKDKGAIQPLNELLDKYGQNLKKAWPKEWEDSWKAVTDKDGNIWAIPIGPGPVVLKANLFRADWLEKLDLQLPKTFDEFEHVLKEFKEKDPAGSGQTIPLITNMTGLNLALAAGFMDVGYGNWLDKDGTIKPPELHPGYREFVAKMADWYKKGYIYKETFTLNTERYRELIKKNRVAAASIHFTTVTNVQYELQKIVPEARYEVAADLKGPQGDVPTSSGQSTWGYVINKKAPNPEATMKYLDWLNSNIDHFLLSFYGVKDKHWRYVDEGKHIVERINEDYVGEFLTGNTYVQTVGFLPNDPAGKPEFDYMGKYGEKLDWGVKKPFTVDVDYLYDHTEISNKLPNQEDINRMISEEITKFIMGARAMSEYDKFIQELYAAGLDKWIEVYTDQYNKAMAGK